MGGKHDIVSTTIIGGLPIKKCDFLYSYIKLPEGVLSLQSPLFVLSFHVDVLSWDEQNPKKNIKKTHDAGPKPLATESGTGDRHFWESPEGITNYIWSKKEGDFSSNQHGDSPILTTKHGDVLGMFFYDGIYKLIIGIFLQHSWTLAMGYGSKCHKTHKTAMFGPF